MPSRTEFTVTEKDSPGTISVKKLSVLFWGTCPIASTTLTVDLLPCHWRHSGFTPITVTTATRTTWSPMSSAE